MYTPFTFTYLAIRTDGLSAGLLKADGSGGNPVLATPGVDYLTPSTTLFDAAGSAASVQTNLNELEGTLGTASAAGLVTTLGTPGSDTNVPSEKAVRTAISAISVAEWCGSVANQAAMLALTTNIAGQPIAASDWCNRTDRGTIWVLNALPASTLANWFELSYPTAPVMSVDGKTGAVSLSGSYDALGAATAAVASLTKGAANELQAGDGSGGFRDAGMACTPWTAPDANWNGWQYGVVPNAGPVLNLPNLILSSSNGCPAAGSYAPTLAPLFGSDALSPIFTGTGTDTNEYYYYLSNYFAAWIVTQAYPVAYTSDPSAGGTIPYWQADPANAAGCPLGLLDPLAGASGNLSVAWDTSGTSTAIPFQPSCSAQFGVNVPANALAMGDPSNGQSFVVASPLSASQFVPRFSMLFGSVPHLTVSGGTSADGDYVPQRPTGIDTSSGVWWLRSDNAYAIWAAPLVNVIALGGAGFWIAPIAQPPSTITASGYSASSWYCGTLVGTYSPTSGSTGSPVVALSTSSFTSVDCTSAGLESALALGILTQAIGRYSGTAASLSTKFVGGDLQLHSTVSAGFYGAWSNATPYPAFATVSYGSQYWQATCENTYVQPLALASQGTYAAGTSYGAGQVVLYSGSYYASKSASNIGHTPSSNPTYWANLGVVANFPSAPQPWVPQGNT